MNTQFTALRLADILEHRIPSIKCLEVAATELRRLHEVNQELVEALILARNEIRDPTLWTEKADAALAKAEVTK